MIRPFTPDDVPELERIHTAHFGDEFPLPDFMSYLCAYIIEDEKGIITVGGVRDIAECVTVTDKSRDPRDRIKALYRILNVSSYVAQRHGYDQLYVWSQNPHWARRLKRNGFRPPDGQSLILDL